MKIATFNIRCDNSRDGLNDFVNRKGLIVDRLNEKALDVIGFQEVRPYQKDYLRRNMPDFTFVGCGTGVGYQGERNLVGFRSDRYELIALDFTWLSDTPYVPGSRFEIQSSCPRVITHIILRPIGEGEPFHFYNTHLDHRSSDARVKGATQLLNKIKADQRTHPFPVIVTGDFNAEPDKPEIRMIVEDEFGFTDQTDGVDTTYHGYGTADGPRIDFIFTRGFIADGKAQRWMEHWENLYYSDHYAVEVELHREDGGML